LAKRQKGTERGISPFPSVSAVSAISLAGLLASMAFITDHPAKTLTEDAEEATDPYAYAMTTEYRAAKEREAAREKVEALAFRERADAYAEEAIKAAESEYRERSEAARGSRSGGVEAAMEGFAYYEIPKECEAQGAAFPEEVQAYAFARCAEGGVDYATVVALIEEESRYFHDLESSSGCLGYMQIIPKWHEGRMEALGVTDPADPCQNIAIGVSFLSELLEEYEGDYGKALTAYNCGPKGAQDNYFSKGIGRNGYAERVMARAEKIRTELSESAREAEPWE